MNEKEIKTRLLVAEALRWIGVTEHGNNAGELVSLFQKTVDGKAQGESWCMAYVQYCLKHALYYYDSVYDGCSPMHGIYSSEHCLTVWNKTPKELRTDKPEIGSIVIWQHGNTSSGHTGIVVGEKADPEFFTTAEGNTGPGAGVVREGDGVFMKTRSVKGSGDMKILGFLLPFGK